MLSPLSINISFPSHKSSPHFFLSSFSVAVSNGDCHRRQAPLMSMSRRWRQSCLVLILLLFTPVTFSQVLTQALTSYLCPEEKHILKCRQAEIRLESDDLTTEVDTDDVRLPKCWRECCFIGEKYLWKPKQRLFLVQNCPSSEEGKLIESLEKAKILSGSSDEVTSHAIFRTSNRTETIGRLENAHLTIKSSIFIGTFPYSLLNNSVLQWMTSSPKKCIASGSSIQSPSDSSPG